MKNSPFNIGQYKIKKYLIQRRIVMFIRSDIQRNSWLRIADCTFSIRFAKIQA
jgi:hypothetical protein